MNQDKKSIETIKEQNKQVGKLFDVWPVIFLFIGIYIASQVFKHTM